jgi:hypothetical protein
MMGLKTRAVTARHTVSLEDLVPPDNCYRHLNRVLELSFGHCHVDRGEAETGE